MQTFSAALDILKKCSCEYETSLKKTLQSNTELKRVVDNMASALDDMKKLFAPGSKCAICCSREMDTALECGHTVCKVCAARALRSERCPFCRRAVTESMRLYL